MDTLGVLVGTKDEDRPSEKAIALKTALKNSGIEAKYSTHYGMEKDDFVTLSISFRE